jgi:hypothetical protein
LTITHERETFGDYLRSFGTQVDDLRAQLRNDRLRSRFHQLALTLRSSFHGFILTLPNALLFCQRERQRFLPNLVMEGIFG